MVVLGLVLPAIPALLPLIYGYAIVPGLFTFCLGRNIGISFYTMILPMSVLAAMSTTMLAIIFWKILKVN